MREKKEKRNMKNAAAVDNSSEWVLVSKTSRTRYYVNRAGKCKVENLVTGETKISNGYFNKWTGYMQFAGSYVHRLVAKAFLPNLKRRPQVHHINSNPRDNRAENLAWVTCKENNSTEDCRIRKRESWRSTKRKDQIIKAVKFDGTVKYFKNGYDCAEYLDCSHVLVYNCLNGKLSAKRARGWTLKWVQLASGEPA